MGGSSMISSSGKVDAGSVVACSPASWSREPSSPSRSISVSPGSSACTTSPSTTPNRSPPSAPRNAAHRIRPRAYPVASAGRPGGVEIRPLEPQHRGLLGTVGAHAPDLLVPGPAAREQDPVAGGPGGVAVEGAVPCETADLAGRERDHEHV